MNNTQQLSIGIIVMFWARNQKKKKRKEDSVLTQCICSSGQTLRSVQTNCMLHDQTKYWLVCCCSLTNPLLTGGEIYICLPGFMFIFSGVFFLSLLFGTHFEKHCNFIQAFYQFKYHMTWTAFEQPLLLLLLGCYSACVTRL